MYSYKEVRDASLWTEAAVSRCIDQTFRFHFSNPQRVGIIDVKLQFNPNDIDVVILL